MRHGESDIGFDENSKMNRLDAERDGDGGQNWDENNQRRQRVHEHPDQEKQDLNQQKEQIFVVRDLDQGGGERLRNLGDRHGKSQDRAHCKNQKNHALMSMVSRKMTDSDASLKSR